MAGNITRSKSAELSSFGVVKAVPPNYANGDDAIKKLEDKIAEFDNLIEDLEDRKNVIETEIEYDVVSNPNFSNDMKRKAEIKYRFLNSDELQKINGDLRIYRREVHRLTREKGNEYRAFQWIVGD